MKRKFRMLLSFIKRIWLGINKAKNTFFLIQFCNMSGKRCYSNWTSSTFSKAQKICWWVVVMRSVCKSEECTKKMCIEGALWKNTGRTFLLVRITSKVQMLKGSALFYGNAFPSNDTSNSDPNTTPQLCCANTDTENTQPLQTET